MRPWRLRLTARRSRVQWALLSVVLLVSTLAATLLGTLYLLTFATETFAARAATTSLDVERIQVIHRLTPGRATTLDGAFKTSTAAAAEHLGAVPFASHLHAETALFNVPRGDDQRDAMSYLATFGDVESMATLLAGEWPSADSAGIEVTVPPRFLWETDTQIGDRVQLSRIGDSTETVLVRIVGTYVSDERDTGMWTYDRYRGDGFRPNQAVPFTNNMVFTDAIGALLTTPAALEGLTLSAVDVQHIPDFEHVSVADLRAVIDATPDAGKVAQRHIAANADGVTVMTQIDQSLGGVVGSLAITNSSVLVTALLLLVLAVAALSQTARLMAERRHAEQHLMAARGGSMRQMFTLGALEALGLAAVTAGLAAPLSRLAYLQLASLPAMEDAGLRRDPGIPAGVWIVTGIVGLALLLVLAVPLLKRSGSFVDAEQAKSRPGRRAAFQRSGLDVGVVALAALAYWQLRSYRSPVQASDGVASVDPLLAAGPALALLAGGLVAVRLIPAASKILEKLATTGRRATLPLAAWEVGRRAPRAVSAVLLLTLATSIGTFSVSFLTTWQQSQRDQAQFQHPADVVVSGVDADGANPIGLLSSDLAAAVSPVVDRPVEIDAAPSGNVSNADDRFYGKGAWLIATDDAGLRVWGEGRVGASGGYRIPSALSHGIDEESDPIPLPAGAEGVRMTVTMRVAGATLYGSVAHLTAVFRDADRQYYTVPLGTTAVDGEPRVMTAFVPEEAGDGLALIGLQLQTYVSEGIEVSNAAQVGIDFTMAVSDLVAIEDITPVPVVGVPARGTETPLEIDGRISWHASAQGMSPTGQIPPAVQGDLVAAAVVSTRMLSTGVRLTLTSEPVASQFPVVASSSALDATRLDMGDPIRVSIDGTVFDAWVAQRVARVPGDHLRGTAIVANIGDVQLALIQRGLPPLTPTEYWIDVADEDASSYAASAAAAWTVTSREGLARSFALDSLRIAIQAALWLVAGAAAVLAAVGFAVHAVVTMRAREIEFAQLRAVGLQHSQLLRVVSIESVMLSILGTVFGVALGAALAYLVAPLISVGTDGRLPIPGVIVHIPWEMVALLAVEVAAVVTVTIAIVAVMLRRIKPAQMLRMGDER